MSNRRSAYCRGERGFSLLEVLAAMLLLSITSLAVARSAVLAYRLAARSERDAAALQLALWKMEEMSGGNPVALSDANDSIEAAVMFDNVSFRRVTDVTVNDDNSRSVRVVVTSNIPELGGNADLRNTFALWGTM